MHEPPLLQIAQRLYDVLNRASTREEVADWAMQYVNNDEVIVNDSDAWELLKKTGGIDLYQAPGKYLYNDDDIQDWINNMIP